MCGGGGGGGQRALEQEEKDLLRMQTRVAEQGIQGRTEAMGGYRDFVSRGREMGSLANQEREGGRAMQDAYTAYGNTERMRTAQMESMGVNPGDARFQRGRDTAGVGMAAGAAGAANAARTNTRREALGLEAAGYSGLAGFDPSGALNSMAGTIGNAQRTSMQASANEAQGWGNLAQAGMYGLKNGDAIGKSLSSIGGWLGGGGGGGGGSGDWYAADGGYVHDYADGGEVMGMQRYAQGGNVYDQAMGEMDQAGQGISARQAAPNPQPQQPGVDPLTATRLAKFAVDKVAGSTLGYSTLPGVAAGGEQAAMLAAQTGEFGAAGLGATAEAAATAAGVEGLSGAAALGGAGAALGTAIPVIGGAMLLGGALGLFKDGGNVPKQGIGGKQRAGRAENTKGGKVSGPGGPKDDKVMARLSPGEFVMPVGSVQKFGLDRLEKMRQAGLEFEKQRKIG